MMSKIRAMLENLSKIKDPKLRTAWGIAIAADITQWILLPVFSAGALSPLDDLLDIVVGLALVRLLGWHWGFLPAFATELLPGVDLLPTWTAAVFLVSRNHVASNEPEIIPPGAAPTR